MLKKIRLRLTLLSAGITILILVCMSLFSLIVSEKNLRENSFSSFCNDMNTLLSNLETQTVFSHEWLSKMEGNGKYMISITDNGKEFLWSQREDQKRRTLVQAAWDYYNSVFLITPAPQASIFSTWHTEFPFSPNPSGKPAYYACAAISTRPAGSLSVMILMPTEALQKQLSQQRLTVALLVTLAGVILVFFSWYFTGKLLAPVEKSRIGQISFVASASHELRTPLSVILSCASACKKAEGEEQIHFLNIIEETGQSMSRLISDLLLLSGADSKTLSFHPRNCEPDTLLLDIYESFEPLAKKEGYLLSVILPEEKTNPVRLDPDRIRQVFSILLHNAFCYTPVGSRIELTLKQQDKKLFFFVADNGSGIADDQKERIFERFYRKDASRNGDGHFGLGLSIAQQVMRACGGDIFVKDTPGGGATFVLWLRSGSGE